MAIPVSLEDAKLHLRLELDDTSQDQQVGRWIADAAAWVERYTGHILEAREVTETFAGFRPVALRAWPIAADAVPTVTYLDGTGTSVPIQSARKNAVRPAKIGPRAGHFWPFIDPQQAFTVTIRAGYEDADAVPGDFRRAMLMLIAAYDADREGGDAFAKAERTAKSLCRSYRMMSL